MANDRAFDKSIFMQFLISNIWFEQKCYVEINRFNSDLNLNILISFYFRVFFTSWKRYLCFVKTDYFPF